MPNSMMLFNFFVFGQKYFFGQIWSKNQNYHFKLKFGGWLNSNMQNSMMLFTFFVFDRKCPFGANLVQIVNIASLRWNLIPTLIRICRIQWCCSFFSVFDWKYAFGGKSGSKSQNFQFKLKFRKYLLLQLKFESGKGAFFHPAFMDNGPTISHVF